MKNIIVEALQVGPIKFDQKDMHAVNFTIGFQNVMKIGEGQSAIAGYLDEWGEKATSILNLKEKDSDREALVYVFPDSTVGIIDWYEQRAVAVDTVTMIKLFIESGEYLND